MTASLPAGELPDLGGDLVAGVLLQEMRRAGEQPGAVAGEELLERIRAAAGKAKSRWPQTISAGLLTRQRAGEPARSLIR